MSKEEPKDKKIKHTQKEIEKNKVKQKFEKLHKEDKKIQKLHEHLEKKGWKQKNEDRNFYGHETLHEAEDGTQATSSITIQDYQKEKSMKGACIGHVEIRSLDHIETYSFALVAEESETVLPDKITEYKVNEETLIVEKAKSYWNCVITQVLNGMGYQIVTIMMGLAITACTSPPPFSWAIFIGGLALACGIWWGGALACCGCNCNWWCRWFSGCCSQ